jgi:hypothetical protein
MRRKIMNKLPAFATLFAVFILSGCTVCTNCEPEYQTDSSLTTVYKYTSYPGGSSTIRTSQSYGSTSTYNNLIPPRLSTPLYYPSYNVAPIINFGPTRSIYNSSYDNYGRSSYGGGGYAGPAFTTPPMQPMPYPTEWYYPFKRLSPGVFVPWNQPRFTAAPSYYPSPPTMYPQQLWYYP